MVIISGKLFLNESAHMYIEVISIRLYELLLLVDEKKIITKLPHSLS